MRLTLHHYLIDKFKGLDCVLAFETASDFLATNKMSYRPRQSVYSLQELNIDDVDCIVVDSYSNLEIVTYDNGIRCTSSRQTIIDLLRYDRDSQVIIEAIADWYFSHGESYEELTVPEDVQPLLDDYKEDAMYYYDN